MPSETGYICLKNYTVITLAFHTKFSLLQSDFLQQQQQQRDTLIVIWNLFEILFVSIVTKSLLDESRQDSFSPRQTDILRGWSWCDDSWTDDTVH